MPSRIGEIRWAVADVAAGVHVGIETPGIFAEEIARGGVVVAGVVVVEARCCVEFLGGVEIAGFARVAGRDIAVTVVDVVFVDGGDVGAGVVFGEVADLRRLARERIGQSSRPAGVVVGVLGPRAAEAAQESIPDNRV